MYMHGLGLVPLAEQYYRSGQYIGPDPMDCEARGGLVNARFAAFDADGRGLPPVSFSCQMPVSGGGGGGGPINISVPTNVQTNVSPQISPAFVQQDQPQNSGVNTGATQTSPASQDASNNDIAELLRALAMPTAQPQASPAMSFPADGGMMLPGTQSSMYGVARKPTWTEIAVAVAAVAGVVIATKKRGTQRRRK